jgi:DNA polymerase III delta prime subunit
MPDTFLWVEQYRPKTVDECILPKTLKSQLQSYVNKQDISNLILAGGPGVGKTTAARAMLEQIGATYMFINGSEESGIDVLRTKIKNFASTVSLEGGRKYLILDEADYLNPQSTQPALRGFMEEFHSNCGFILTCNYKNKLIAPLHSRCGVVDFTIPKSEKAGLAGQFFKRAISILKENEIKYNEKVVAELINTHFPDWRRILNELQRYSVSGEIDAGILVNLGEKNIKDLMGMMKKKEFTNVRKWVVDNIDNDPVTMFRAVYDNMYDYLEPSTIPHVVIILGEYQYKNAFVADPEINMVACLTEIMARGKFK